MLYQLDDGSKRLFKDSDDYHPYREGGKIIPKKEEIPSEYWHLLDWWKNHFNKNQI
jgi:hypothetical protein